MVRQIGGGKVAKKSVPSSPSKPRLARKTSTVKGQDSSATVTSPTLKKSVFFLLFPPSQLQAFSWQRTHIGRERTLSSRYGASSCENSCL